MPWSTLDKIDLSKPEQVPETFIERRIGEVILLSKEKINRHNRVLLKSIMQSPKANQYFAIIENISKVKPHPRGMAAANLMATTGTQDLSKLKTGPDWPDWLIPSEGTIMDLFINWRASSYFEVEMTNLGQRASRIKYGDKQDDRYTDDDLMHIVTTPDWVPNFTVYNPSQITHTFLEARILLGRTLELSQMKDKNGAIPSAFETIVISEVTSS